MVVLRYWGLVCQHTSIQGAQFNPQQGLQEGAKRLVRNIDVVQARLTEACTGEVEMEMGKQTDLGYILVPYSLEFAD